VIAELHVHSCHSFDSFLRPIEIIRIAHRLGLDAIAITDHDTCAGSLEAQRVNPYQDLTVIAATEINTSAGDIVGLFISGEIRSREVMEVIDEIHSQGGIAVLPHPFKSPKLTDPIAQAVDVIEAFNGRASPEQNRQAADLAKKFGKPAVCGSDAHLGFEIGRCRNVLAGPDIRQAVLSGAREMLTKPTLRCSEYLSQMIKIHKLRQYGRIPRKLLSLMTRPFKPGSGQ
jgi:predicted metal-dependent phosphoesterase TrpH